MYYDKLPIILLTEIASGDSRDTNTEIASFILEHFDEIKNDSIRSLAAKAFVSPASISRFCREIGLEDFNQLRSLMQCTTMSYESSPNLQTTDELVEDCFDHLHHCMDMVQQSLNPRKLERLCMDIDRFPRVSIYGPLKASSAAMNLQVDLMMMGKFTRSKICFPQQVKCLEQANQDDLIILFSYTGQYFTYAYGQKRIPESIRKPFIYMITGNPNVRPNGFINEVIYFQSDQEQRSHPYQLLMVSTLISRFYRRYSQEKLVNLPSEQA